MLSDKKRIHSALPRTKAMQKEHQSMGRITGYMKLPRGAPPKERDPPPSPKSKKTKTNPSDSLSVMVVGQTTSKSKQTERKVSYHSWTAGHNKLALEAAVNAVLAGEDPTMAAQKIIPTILIPRQTLDRAVKREAARRNGIVDDVLFESVDDGLFDRKAKPTISHTNSLTTPDFRTELQSIICARDELNNGVSRKEVISMIADFHMVSHKKAEDHFDYMIRAKMLPALKRGGKTVQAQPTTTNRTATTTEKLLRNHTNFVAGLEMVRDFNNKPDEYTPVEDFFCLNLDETNFMASEGTLRVVGSSKKKKQEKNSSDSRDSITIVRIGSAAGTEGPRIFLAKGKSLKTHPSLTPDKFTKNYKSPPGSHVVMTPSAYMTDEAWIEMSERVALGIRCMPKIKDHGDWWCLLSVDGFGSHLKTEALQTFAKHRILVIKEESDSSQVCQAYDQMVAKQDKRVTRGLLEGFRFSRHGIITQFELILIVNTSLNKEGSESAWRTSHIRVNACPSKMQPFTEWLKKHDAAVAAADQFFQSRDSLFDAMPAMWKNMSEIQRRQVCTLLDSLECSARTDANSGSLWSIGNVRKVMSLGFVDYDDIHKLRGCRIVAKEDPSVFSDPIVSAPPPPDRERAAGTLDRYYGYSFVSKELMEKYMEEKIGRGHVPRGHEGPKPDPAVWDRVPASNLFCHMTNYVARLHGWHTGGDLVPSPYLQVEIKADQIDLLNPTSRDVQMAAIIDQCMGSKATKKVAKRRIDMIEGNVNSYARILNGPQQLEQINVYNDLAASIAVLQKEKDELEARGKLEKRKADEAKATRKEVRNQKMQDEQVELGPGCRDDVDKGLIHVLSLTNDRRKQILRIHFGHTSGLSKLNAAGTVLELRKYMEAAEFNIERDNQNSAGDGDRVMTTTEAEGL